MLVAAEIMHVADIRQNVAGVHVQNQGGGVMHAIAGQALRMAIQYVNRAQLPLAVKRGDDLPGAAGFLM